jgi:hypothetical protein
MNLIELTLVVGEMVFSELLCKPFFTACGPEKDDCLVILLSKIRGC